MALKQLESSFYGFMALLKVLALNFEDAEKLLSKGIESNPAFPYNYGLRAYVRIRLDDIDGAIKDCSEKIRLKPDDSSSYALRGWAYYCLGKYSKAIDDIEESIGMDPRRLNYYQDSLRLIDSYQLLDRNEEAIKFIERMLASRVEEYIQIELYGRKAACNLRLQKFDACIDSLDRAMEHASLNDLTELHKMKAEVLQAKGEVGLSEKEQEIYQGLKRFEAQITEWMPASQLKRVLAHSIDGGILGTVVATLFLFLISIWSSFNLGGAVSSNDLALLVVPYCLFFFFISFLDSFFVILIPAVIFTCLSGFYQNEMIYHLEAPYLIVILFFILISVLNCFYHSWFPATGLEATPGKFFLKIRLTNNDGMKPGFKTLFTRHLLRACPGLFFLTSTYLFLYLISLGLHWLADFAFLVTYLLSLFICYGALLRPGIHNKITSTHVLDVTMYSGGELAALGIL